MGVSTQEGHASQEMAVAMTERGLPIYCDPGDPRSAELVAAHGDFNPGSLRLWRHVVAGSAWPVVLDVGVNYGEMLVGVELPPGATVVGFEPNVLLHPYLRRTLDEAGLAVQLRPEALAAHSGTAILAVDQAWSGTTSLLTQGRPAGERWQHQDVPVTTLDDVLGPTPVSFCAKVDVEGFEREVLAGAARSMSWPLPWAFLIEVLHLPVVGLAGLAQRFTLLALDLRTDRLVRLPGGNARLLEQLLGSSWLYPQDCVLANEAAAGLLTGDQGRAA